MEATGGTSGRVDFTALVQNYGAQPVRVNVSATVGDELVECRPNPLDLLVNAEPSRVVIDVPRPELGDLVPEFNNETTLYGEELRFEVTVDEELVGEATWREQIYEAEEDRARFETQQRYWRMGRGEDTDSDRRAEYLAERLRRIENGEENGPDYEWS